MPSSSGHGEGKGKSEAGKGGGCEVRNHDNSARGWREHWGVGGEWAGREGAAGMALRDARPRHLLRCGVWLEISHWALLLFSHLAVLDSF